MVHESSGLEPAQQRLVMHGRTEPLQNDDTPLWKAGFEEEAIVVLGKKPTLRQTAKSVKLAVALGRTS